MTSPAPTREQVQKARYLYLNTSCTLQRIANRFGVSQATVLRAINGLSRMTFGRAAE